MYIFIIHHNSKYEYTVKLLYEKFNSLTVLARSMPTYFYPARQLDSTSSLLWQSCSCLDPTTVGFCCDPWRRLRLVLDGEQIQLDGQTLAVTPAAEAHAVTAESLARYNWLWLWPWPAPAPPGLPVELDVPPRRFAICVKTEEERDRLLQRLRDVIDLSNGPLSPYAEWSFGEKLGEGTFGTVRAVTHRASGEVRSRLKAGCCLDQLISDELIPANPFVRRCPARASAEAEVRID